MYYDEDDREPYYDPEDFLEEYEVNLRDIITKAVNDKIKDTIEELQSLKDENKSLSKEIGELKRNNYNIERLHKEQLEKALKEKELEVQKKLSCGFAPHDKVWYIESEAIRTKCDQCNGNYNIETEVLGKMTKVHCPHCSYGNKIKHKYHVKQDIISSVYFNYYREDRDKKSGILMDIKDIYLVKCDNSKTPKSLYKTLEECQIECDKRNNEEAPNQFN